MPDGDGAAVDIELGLIDPELARAGHALRAEGLIDLEPADLVEAQPALLQHRADRRHRADAHEMGRHADARPRDDARQRLALMRAHIAL